MGEFGREKEGHQVSRRSLSKGSVAKRWGRPHLSRRVSGQEQRVPDGDGSWAEIHLGPHDCMRAIAIQRGGLCELGHRGET